MTGKTCRLRYLAQLQRLVSPFHSSHQLRVLTPVQCIHQTTATYAAFVASLLPSTRRPRCSANARARSGGTALPTWRICSCC